MANAVIHIERVLTLNLTLNDTEASFLMSLVQNPQFENEAVIYSQLRQTIFNALKAQGVK